jgi:ATP-dependent exoDNAse (exonuclease V) beta subunit
VLSEPELLAADSSARREALDPGRSFIVQAPAGSGKTELLIQRYLTLLGRVENPEEVLAITFTRKAAAEMQHRVLQALNTARDGVRPKADYLRVTYEAARHVLERDAASGWQLMDAPGRMRIQTMDALNARLSRTLPMSSGLGGQVPTLADAEMDAIYRAAAVALLDDWLLVPGKIRDALESLLRHLDNNTRLFINYVAAMLAKRDQWLKLIGAGGLTGEEARIVRRRLENTIRNLVGSHLDTLRASCSEDMVRDLPALAVYAGTNLAAQGGDERLVEGLLACANFPEGRPEDIDTWRALAQLLLTKQGNWRKPGGVNVGAGFPPGDTGQKEALAGLLAQLGEDEQLREMLFATLELPPPRYEEEQWKVLLSLFELLPTAVAELRSLFAVRGVTDHIEVALAASRALGSIDEPGELALLMDYKVSHLLIDEMQDTSLSQYELVARLTAGWEPGDGRSLFCVGDPMQSIYRFRNAEVGQFLLAQTEGIGSVRMDKLVLRRNFRSGEHLVHWFNDTFSATFPQTQDVLYGAIDYERSAPVDLHSGQGTMDIHPLFNADRSAEAALGLEVIR